MNRNKPPMRRLAASAKRANRATIVTEPCALSGVTAQPREPFLQ
jgi:hypothetical protein